MLTLALNMNMSGRLVIVIGGGSVALRKLRSLLAAGISVKVVAVSACAEVVALSSVGSVELRLGSYDAADLDRAFLVFAATNDAVVNKQVCADARDRGILASSADHPADGDFTFPALLKHGYLEIAVSTGGLCPTFAADVRDQIAEIITNEYGAILDKLGAEREKLLTKGNSNTYNAQVLRSLSRCLLAELAERKETLS